jgi:hypothetical protein
MAGPSHLRIAAPALVVLATLAVSATAHAGILPSPDPPPAVLGTTGDDSELRTKIPIAKQPGARERVAMQLGPGTIAPIQLGDRLRASGEVQVSTTCVDPGPRCVGRNYEVNPTVTAKIVLSPSPEANAGFLPLSPSRSVLCKQRRPNRNHHCTIAIPNTETAITDLAALPCAPEACYVNMIVGASSGKAKKGNVVVLGADRPDATVEGDKGRLNVVQAHADVPAPTVSSSSTLVNTELPLTEGDDEKRRVVYSVPIEAARAGEVLAFDASYLTGISALRFNTFVSSRVVLGTEPTSTKGTGLARSAMPLKGQATESNGFNCTLGASGFANPCTNVKAGAAAITRDAVEKKTGLPVTLYLNVVAAAKPLLAEKVDPSSQVSLGSLPAGLTVYRYAP